ncbi:MAG: peptide ABC transporter substrate-binding protein [Gemmatimonadaceae bacterium]
MMLFGPVTSTSGRADGRHVRRVISVCAAITLACAAPERPAGTAVIASGADLESANPLVTVHPLSRQVQRYVLFVTLARYDDRLQPEPYLAREWRWSTDRRGLELTLRSGLRWHDGVETTARDVLFTLQAARDPATGFPRYADFAGVTAVTSDSDTSVTIAFASPQAGFPLVLCELPIVPEHILGSTPRSQMREAAFGTAPVGNGPFRFAGRSAGQRWLFERNESFPAQLGGPPKLSRFIVAVVDEATTKFAGLVSGELDVAGISPGMADLAARDPTLRVLDYPVLFTSGIVFNTAKPPLDDRRVRRAIALSLNRQRIIDVAVAGFGTPAFSPVLPDHPYAADAGIGFDTVVADSLLESAGWIRAGAGPRKRLGRSLELELLTVGSADNAIEQLVQADLGARGIRTEIRQREMGAFLSEARANPKRFDALFTGIPGDVSLAHVSAMFDSGLAGGALDYAGYHTPILDKLLARARAAPSSAVARERWLEVQRELQEGAPVAWVYHARGVQGLAQRLQGVKMDLRGELVSVTQWYVDPASKPVASQR